MFRENCIIGVGGGRGGGSLNILQCLERTGPTFFHTKTGEDIDTINFELSTFRDPFQIRNMESLLDLDRHVEDADPDQAGKNHQH